MQGGGGPPVAGEAAVLGVRRLVAIAGVLAASAVFVPEASAATVTWVLKNQAGPVRSYAVIAYDAARQEVVLFGG